MDQTVQRQRIARLSLEHWFVNHQLRRIRREHFHLPGSIDIDVQDLLARVPGEDPAAFATILTIKALGLCLEVLPEANRIYMRTLFGERLVQPDYVGVNVPIRLRYGDRTITTATRILNPHRMSLLEIKNELRLAVGGGVAAHPVARFLVTHKNTWFNRMRLRVLGLLAYRVPSLYLRFQAGGVSLSSLLYEGKDALPMTTVSFGPTAFTVMLNSLWRENGRWKIRLGVGFDHMAAGGELAVVFAKRLAKILGGEDHELYPRLCEGLAKHPDQRPNAVPLESLL